MHFPGQSGHTLGDLNLHQVIVGQLLFPKDFRPKKHLFLMCLIECPGILFMVLIEKVGIDAFPLIPQLGIDRLRYDRPVFACLISWILKHVIEKRVIVEYGAYVHDVCIGVPCL